MPHMCMRQLLATLAVLVLLVTITITRCDGQPTIIVGSLQLSGSSQTGGAFTFTSLSGGNLTFQVSGDIRAVDPFPSSYITNINNNGAPSVIIRYGAVNTLTSSSSITGLSVCESVTVTSNITQSQVICTVGYGIARNLSFSLWNATASQVISWDNQPSSSTDFDRFGYPSPTLVANTIRSGDAIATAGGHTYLAQGKDKDEVIAIDATNLDPNTLLVTYGPAGSTNVTGICTVNVTKSTQTLLVCKTQGLKDGTSTYFTIYQGDWTYTSVDANEYRYPVVPSLSAVWGCNGTLNRTDQSNAIGCPTAGGVIVTMCGDNWDASQSIPIAFVNGNPCTQTLPVTNKTLLGSVADEGCPVIVTCVLPEGAGASQSAVVSADGQFSVPIRAVSYAPPDIQFLRGCQPSTTTIGSVIECDREGMGQNLTLIGANFGPKQPRVFIGNDECTNLQWYNHSYVTCTIPQGVGTQRSVILLQLNGGISSSKLDLSFKACLPGTQPDGFKCVECPLGYYSPLGLACQACSAGTFSNVTGRVSCFAAPIGFAQKEAGASMYQVCEDGSYAPQSGLSGCLPCAAGSWSYGGNTSLVAKSTCTKCPVGTFGTGARPCQPCDDLKYATQEGQSQCTVCAGAVYIIKKIVNGTTVIECPPCPSGVSCLDGKITTNSEYYLAEQADLTYRSLVCLPGFCKACDNNNAQTRLQQCCTEFRQEEDNPMCAKCSDGYVAIGNDCKICNKANIGTIVLLLLVSFLFLFIFHRASQATQKTSDTQQFLYFMQMLIIFFGPESGWISWLSFVNLNVFNSGGNTCVLPISPMGRLLSGIVLPFIGLAQLMFIFAFDYGLWKCWKNKTRGYDHKLINWLLPKSKTFKSTPVRRTLIVFYLSSYNSVVTAVLQYFTCLEVSDTGISVVQAFPGISCTASEYTNVKPFMWFVCIVFVAISPLLVLAALVYNHRKGRLQDIKHTTRYGPLYAHYKPDRYYWSFVTIIRRVVLITLVAQLGYDRPLMFSWVTFTNILMLLVHMIARPFASISGNNIETGLLTLHALVTTLMTTLPFPLGSRDSAGMSVLVFVPAIGFLIYMVSTRAHVLTARIAKLGGGGGGGGGGGTSGTSGTSGVASPPMSPTGASSPVTGQANGNVQDSSSSTPVPLVGHGGTIVGNSDNGEDGVTIPRGNGHGHINDDGGVELQQISTTMDGSSNDIGDTKSNTAMLSNRRATMTLPPASAIDSSSNHDVA